MTNYLFAQQIVPAISADLISKDLPTFLSCRSASLKAILENDTISAIKILEKFVDKNPQNLFFETANYAIGTLYTKINSNKLATKAFLKLLHSGRKDCRPLIKYDKTDSSIFKEIDEPVYNGYKYSACFKLYELSLSEHHFGAALKYLNSVDKYYSTFSFECGNAYYSKKEMMNFKYAEFYLAKHDTLNATKKFWACVIEDYSYGFSMEAATKLREILYAKYSNSQIRAEINKGISELKTVKLKESDRHETLFEISFFGATVITDHFSSKDIKKIKENIQNSYLIYILKQKNIHLSG